MSSPVLDATTSVTSGVLSFMLRSQSVRLNQPEDYTVPRPVLGAAPPPARERNRARQKSRKISRGSDSSPQGPIACAISRNIRTRSSPPFATSSKSNLPATTSQRSTVSPPSSRPSSKPWADALVSIAAPTSATICRSTSSPEATTRKPVLLLGHYDTVYPLGTLATMPCRIEDGRLRGPGVLDMKSGIALMLHAIAALQAWHGQLPRPVTVFLVSDEEVGSYSSRKITEALAKQSAGVLVLEPAAGLRGAVKTARKGRRRIHAARERRRGTRRTRSRQRTQRHSRAGPPDRSRSRS